MRFNRKLRQRGTDDPPTAYSESDEQEVEGVDDVVAMLGFDIPDTGSKTRAGQRRNVRRHQEIGLPLDDDPRFQPRQRLTRRIPDWHKRYDDAARKIFQDIGLHIDNEGRRLGGEAVDVKARHYSCTAQSGVRRTPSFSTRAL